MERAKDTEEVEKLNEYLNENKMSDRVIDYEEMEDQPLIDVFLDTIENLPISHKKALQKDYESIVTLNNDIIDEQEKAKDNKSTPTKEKPPKKEKEGKTMGRPKKEATVPEKPTKAEKPAKKTVAAEEKKGAVKKQVSSGSFSAESNVGRICEMLKKPMTFQDLVEVVKKKIGEKSASPSNVRVYLSQINAKGLLMKKDDKYYTK